MLKKLLIPVFTFALAACSHTVVAPARSVDTQVATVAAPVSQPTLDNSNTQTYSDKGWSLTVPKTMVRQEADPTGTFDALDKKHRMTMFLQSEATPYDLDHAVGIFAVQLASRNISVQKIEGVTWAGEKSVLITSTKEVHGGLIHFYSWATIANEHLYHFGCIAFPDSNVATAEQVCRTAAGTVKLTFPAVSEDTATPAPMIRTTN